MLFQCLYKGKFLVGKHSAENGVFFCNFINLVVGDCGHINDIVAVLKTCTECNCTDGGRVVARDDFHRDTLLTEVAEGVGGFFSYLVGDIDVCHKFKTFGEVLTVKSTLCFCKDKDTIAFTCHRGYFLFLVIVKIAEYKFGCAKDVGHSVKGCTTPLSCRGEGHYALMLSCCI